MIWRFVTSFFVGLFLMFSASSKAMALDHSHKLWTKVLGQYVVSGAFNYRDLKKSQESAGAREFKEYLRQLETVTPSEYGTFSKAEQMAFLINAYNAFTVKLILDHYPLKSIRDIGGFFTNPWSIEYFSLLGGKIRSLDPIEHEYLRPLFQDHRIHAALNCASKSCPELRAEAFVPERLDEQLDDQMRKWLQDQSRNRVDASSKTIYLSKIFDWYGKDFDRWGGGASSVLTKHAAQVFTSSVGAGYKVRYLEYDWSLNEMPIHH